MLLQIPDMLTADELRTYCSAHLAPYAVPRHLTITHEPLPRTASGTTDQSGRRRGAVSRIMVATATPMKPTRMPMIITTIPWLCPSPRGGLVESGAGALVSSCTVIPCPSRKTCARAM